MNMKEVWEIVELRGHIIDSLILSKVYDEIMARGGTYLTEEIDIGRTKDDPSFAKLKVTATDRKTLDSILTRIGELGAAAVGKKEVLLQVATKDGVFPGGFYSTTNLETEIFHKGNWVSVTGTSMDSGILVEGGAGVSRTLKMKDVKKGDVIAVGSAGVRVLLPEKRRDCDFRFMSSGVSSEKPTGPLIAAIAEEIKEIKDSGQGQGGGRNQGQILFVCGPAIVHTGGRDYLAGLIEGGYVDLLFAGNALAVHDMEVAIYGTSLGVSLKEGDYTHEGHNHHIRVINTIRDAGGIKAAVESGVIKDGIMFSCIKNGVDFVLAGSIRDDGPLPEVITDVLIAQDVMREKLKGVTMVVMISTMLHSIAVGNMLGASVRTVCVDIDPSAITKLSDRGTGQATGLVMDAGTFLKELSSQLSSKLSSKLS